MAFNQGPRAVAIDPQTGDVIALMPRADPVDIP